MLTDPRKSAAMTVGLKVDNIWGKQKKDKREKKGGKKRKEKERENVPMIDLRLYMLGVSNGRTAARADGKFSQHTALESYKPAVLEA